MKKRTTLTFFCILVSLIITVSTFYTKVYAYDVEANIVFVPGDLRIVNASSFGFGTQNISAATLFYSPQDNNVSVDVSDLRGTGAGWTLNALASRFYNGGTPSLPGARMYLEDGQSSTEGGVVQRPFVTQSIVLDCDGATTSLMAWAIPGAGMGNSSIEWLWENVYLEVLGGTATVGNHIATINWSLQNAP